MRRYLTALFLLIISTAIGQGRKIGLIDLEYTLKTDPKTAAGVKTAWDDVHTIATLQGVVNRKSPSLYVFLVKNGSADIDRYWWNKYRAKSGWLSKYDTIMYKDVVSLITAYRHKIKGAVVYDPAVPATSNVASSVAGIDDLIAVRYDTAKSSLYSRIITSGPKIPVMVSLVNVDGPMFTGKGLIPETERFSTGSAKNDAYIWFLERYMKRGKCNTKYGAYYIDQQWMQGPTVTNRNHHTLTNHDFFVSRKGFFFDLSPWEDEPATDDPGQKPGTDLKTLKELLLTAYYQNKGTDYAYLGGFPPWAYKYTKHAKGKHEDVETEWQYAKIISAYNAFKDADAIGYGAQANSSFWQHYPLKKEYKQDWVTHADLQKRGYLTADGKVDFKGRNFMIFYVGDYDAASWLTQTTPTLWDDPNRGKVPMMWCISPVLAERVPMAMEYRRLTASHNDYFAAADNGAGYLMPGMLQEPRPISHLPDGLDAWAAHNKPFYKKWGLSITGFIIDGAGPGLNEKGLDAYAQFSPNGIVPQKTPLTLLHGNMPVIRADADINQGDPAEAARNIIDRVKHRKIPFHWFRNILKSPSWYVKVVEEVKKLDPSIELLDAPTFFELYRTYLKENPDAAQGKIN